jgi:hypothetical protein
MTVIIEEESLNRLRGCVALLAFIYYLCRIFEIHLTIS